MQSSSITSKVVAGILSVVAPVAAAVPAASADVCAKYKGDGPSYAQCLYNEKGKQIVALKKVSADAQRVTAEAERITASAQRDGDCTRTMMAGLQNGKYKADDIKRIYAGRPVQSVNSCEVLALLPKG